MTEQEPEKSDSEWPGFWAYVGRSFADGAKESLRWFLIGAVIGAVVLGGVGAYYFGWTGLGIGLIAGAVIGGIGLWWMYMSALP